MRDFLNFLALLIVGIVTAIIIGLIVYILYLATISVETKLLVGLFAGTLSFVWSIGRLIDM